MDREAFLRARRFLDHSPAAKWTAYVAAVCSGVLYIALLAILGLFADLMVSRGRIPALGDLSAHDQRAALIGHQDLPANRAWQDYVLNLLEKRVGPEAADFVRDADLPDKDVGVLSLVVRSHNHFYGPAVGLLARWNPWMWSHGNDRYPSSYYYLLGLFMAAFALAGLRALSRSLGIVAAARASVEATTRLRRAVYHHTFRLGNLAVQARGPSAAVGIFTHQIEAVHNGLIGWLTVSFREPIKLVLVLLFALVINFWLALATLFFALLVWLIGGRVASYYRRQGRVAMQKAAEQLALVQESLMLMRLVKLFEMEHFNQTRVERQLARYARAQERRNFGEAIYRPLFVLLGMLAASIILAAAGYLVLNRQLSVANAVTLATALVSLYWPLVAFLENRRVIRRARSASVVLFKFLEQKSEVGQIVGAEFLAPLSEQLELDDVSLRDPGSKNMLLEGVTGTIRAGQRVALVGADDMEKHALVYLLTRFIDPTNGEIKIDKHNLRWVTLDSLRAQIGVVLQHSLVFNDTVANNIGCGDSSYTLPRIIDAAKLAHAHQFIQKLPQGYETQIGEMGQPIPKTLQFLIALARVILRDPALVIIEEPLAPLDEEMKAILDDTYARFLPGRTAVLLPHRATTIRSCDNIFLLHKGRLEAIGEHRELLAQNEIYRHLHYLEFNELAEEFAS